MVSARTLTITGIIVVLLCAGLFFYTQHRNQKFAEQLSTPQSIPKTVEASVNETPEFIDGTTANNPSSQTDKKNVETLEVDTPAADTQKHSDAIQAEIEIERDTEDNKSHSQSEIDTIFDDAFAFFDDFSVFDSINVEATRAELEKLLRELYSDDPRISEFLGHWDTTSSILSLRTEYNKTGAIDANLREQILEMKPTEVLPKAFELGTELMQPSEVIVTKRGEWLQGWVELTEQVEVAHFAGTLAKEAYNNREITAQEAEDFIEEVSGLDVNVETVEGASEK